MRHHGSYIICLTLVPGGPGDTGEARKRRASSFPGRGAGAKRVMTENELTLLQEEKEEGRKNKELMAKLLLEKENEVNLLQEEKKEAQTNKELVAMLVEKVECPVCLVAPREGPVPCCPSGHITCSPCLEKLRGKGEVECPTCRLPLGKGMSLLAKVVIEHMKHQCSLEGCQEMVAFEGYKEHQEACSYRLVVCPGWGQDCLMVPF